MIVQVSNINKVNTKSSNNYALFANEKFEVSNLKDLFSKNEISFIREVVQKKHDKKNFIIFNLNSKKQVILIKTKKNPLSYEIENLGADFINFIKTTTVNNFILSLNNTQLNKKTDQFLQDFLLGIKLKSYEFNLYKSKKTINKININRMPS